jgi:hypothetical protein
MGAANGPFSDYCHTKMWVLFNNHTHEVGDRFEGPRRNRALTNCIIYFFNVVSYGYERLGRTSVVAALKSIFPRQNGMQLAKYLVTLGWKAHYWNPDVYNTYRGDNEHKISFTDMALYGHYYDVPLSGLIVGYNKQEKTKIEHRGWFWPFGHDVKVSTEDPANIAVFNDLKTLKFAVGINRGGKHCFLMSAGEVLEVHWDREGPRLYGKENFYGYEWLSGVILTPPDSSFNARSIADVKAKM